MKRSAKKLDMLPKTLHNAQSVASRSTRATSPAAGFDGGPTAGRP